MLGCNSQDNDEITYGFLTLEIRLDIFQITSIKQFWDWVQTGLVPNLYVGQWYNGDDPDYDQEFFFGDRNSFIVGYPVMRQVRVKQGKLF